MKSSQNLQYILLLDLEHPWISYTQLWKEGKSKINQDKIEDAKSMKAQKAPYRENSRAVYFCVHISKVKEI